MVKVTLNPDAQTIASDFQKHFNAGLEHLQKGEIEPALEDFNNSLKVNPLSAATYTNLAVIHLSRGDFSKAQTFLEKATLLDSTIPEAFLNLGAVYKGLGQLDLAIKNYRQALVLRPNYAEAIGNIGSCLRDQGDLKGALVHFQKAIKLNANISDFTYNIGNVYAEMGKLDLAEKYYNQAIDANPNYFNAYYNLGTIYQDRGELEKAAKTYFSCLNLNPFYDDCWGNLAVVLQAMCRWDLFEKSRARLKELTTAAIQADRRPGEPPFFTITARDDLAYAKEVATAWSHDLERLLPNKPIFKFTKHRKSSTGKIRLGWVSDGFRQFPTAQNLLGVLEKFDKNQFEIYIYSYGPDDKSLYRKRAKDLADKFIDISQINYLQSAEKINTDNIDILVDLKGYSRGNRIKIMALKPAPITVSFLGYAGTTGSKFIDYLIADKIVIPQSHQKYYTEKVVYLPHSYWPTDDLLVVATTKYKRSDLGIPKGAFVFASFNQAYKITNEVFETWIDILRHTPKGVLVLWQSNDQTTQNLTERFMAAGLKKQRLIFAPTLPKPEHLARLRDIVDLALDTDIVNGHTTTTDCLWAGIPVITVLGNHFMSRVCASLLTDVGLPELITKTLKDYSRLAIKLATHPSQLSNLKTKLQKNLKTSSLFNTNKYTRNLEAAFTKIWQDYLKN